MELREFSIYERIAALPEAFQIFANLGNNSEAMIHCLEMAEMVDTSMEGDIKKIHVEFSNHLLSMRDVFSFVRHYISHRDFRTRGTELLYNRVKCDVDIISFVYQRGIETR